MEWWPVVALGLIGLAVGGGFIWRALIGGPTRHERQEKQDPLVNDILRAKLKDAERKDGKEKWNG